MNQAQNSVTFEDLFLRFSPGEWKLLDDAQKRLYRGVILDNFALVSSLGLPITRPSIDPQMEPQREPRRDFWLDMATAMTQIMGFTPDLGGWCKVQGEGAPSEQSAFLRASQDKTLKAGPYIPATHPCDLCRSVKKEILHLAVQQGILPEQQPYICKSCGRNFWYDVQQKGEKVISGETGQPPSVKSCTFQRSERAFTCSGNEQGSSASSVLVHHQGTPNEEKSHTSTECSKAIYSGQRYQSRKCGKIGIHKVKSSKHQKFQNKEKPFKCNECGKAFHDKETLAQHQKFHSGERAHVCSTCGKSFSRKTSLVGHEKTHTEENYF
jgi:KRAB domain-containing zinc finger protein